MKKLFALLMAAVLCLSMLAACGGTSPSESKTNVEEIGIVDQNGVKAVTKGMGKYEGEFFNVENALLIDVTNSTDKKLSVSLEEVSVNGYMVESGYSFYVEPGATTVFPGVFDENTLERCGITTFANVSFVFVAETEDYEEVVRTPLVTVNLDPDYKIEYDESGTVIYDKDGVKLIAKGVEDSEYMGKCVSILAVNETEKTLEINIENEGKLNGADAQLYYASIVSPGKRSIELLSFEGGESIKEIKDVTFSVTIYDHSSGDEIVSGSESFSLTL